MGGAKDEAGEAAEHGGGFAAGKRRLSPRTARCGGLRLPHSPGRTALIFT